MLITYLFLCFLALAHAQAKYYAQDVDNCRYKDFEAARKRMSTYPASFNPNSNPCGKYNCGKSGYYCQCSWKLQNCLGTRYDCPVNYWCTACPRGYTCNGNGFAVRNRLTAQPASYLDQVVKLLPPYLRGSPSSSESIEQN